MTWRTDSTYYEDPPTRAELLADWARDDADFYDDHGRPHYYDGPTDEDDYDDQEHDR